MRRSHQTRCLPVHSVGDGDGDGGDGDGGDGDGGDGDGGAGDGGAGDGGAGDGGDGDGGDKMVIVMAPTCVLPLLCLSEGKGTMRAWPKG